MPYAQANGVDLYYEEAGSGEPLLLIAPTGWPGSVWKSSGLDALKERYRVIAYDQRGVGKSSKSDVEYSTQLLADDAAALLRAIDAAPAHVFGVSPGGGSAQFMALDSPTSVRSLVLAAASEGTPGAPGDVPARTALEIADPGYGTLEFWLHHLTLPLTFTPRFVQEHPDEVRALAETILSGAPPLKLYLRHVIARTGHDVVGRLGEIRVPTLVLVGEDDHHEGTANHYRESEKLAAAIPGARFHAIPGARHLFPWEAPEATRTAVLNFLQAV